MRTTRKAIILAVLVGLLLVTYASSLRIFFDQQLQIARAEDEIARQEEAIAALQDEITRWEDPEYVKAQARSPWVGGARRGRLPGHRPRRGTDRGWG